MKKCRNCGQLFDETQEVEGDPALELAHIYLESIETVQNELCPPCREELGMMNLLGFIR